jgi:hypothetical protein
MAVVRTLLPPFPPPTWAEEKSTRTATSTTAGVEAAKEATAVSPVDQPPLAVDQPPLAVDQPNLAVDQPNLAVKEPDAAFDQPATLKAATEPPPKKKSTRGQTPTRRSARNVVAAKRRPTASPEMERSSPSHGLILSHHDNLDLDIDLSTDRDPEYPTAPQSLKPPPSPPPLPRALPTPALPTTASSTADLRYYSSSSPLTPAPSTPAQSTLPGQVLCFKSKMRNLYRLFLQCQILIIFSSYYMYCKLNYLKSIKQFTVNILAVCN